MNLVVGFADALNVDYLKASSLHYAAKLKVRFGTVESVHHPLDFLQTPLPCISVRQRRECQKHAFAAAIDLREFDNQTRAFDSELSKDFRSPSAKHKRLTCEHESIKLLIWQIKNFVRGVAFNVNLSHGIHPQET